MRVRRSSSAFAFLVLIFSGGHSHAAPHRCSDCQLLAGIGGTYHFWSSTGGTVVPLTLVWDEDRYEVGVFRMASSQSFYNPYTHEQRQTADPYWGLSASRRWELIKRPLWRVFFGFGASYKTETNELSITRLNFASQLGVRYALNGTGTTVELSMRHWSNAGIRLPNRGQDFATLSFVFSPARLGERLAGTRAREETAAVTR